MESMELFVDEHIVKAGHYTCLMFNLSQKSKRILVSLNAQVWQTGKDINIFIVNRNDFDKWSYWSSHKTVQKRDSQGKAIVDEKGLAVYEDVPEPKTKRFVDYRSVVFKEKIDLEPDDYVLVFDNTYSFSTDKTFAVYPRYFLEH